MSRIQATFDALAEGPHHAEDLREADAARQRTFAGLLDHRTIGHRVRERYAELDDIGSRRRHRQHDLGRGVGVRIAGRHVRDQRLPAFALQSREGRRDAAHFGPFTATSAPLTLWPLHDGRQ